MSETHSCKNTFRRTTSLTETILKKDFAAVEQVNSSSEPGKDCSQHMSQRLQFGKKVFSADWRGSWRKYEWLFYGKSGPSGTPMVRFLMRVSVLIDSPFRFIVTSSERSTSRRWKVFPEWLDVYYCYYRYSLLKFHTDRSKIGHLFEFLPLLSPRHGREVGTLWIPFYRLQGTRPTTSATDVATHVVSPVCNDFASPKVKRTGNFMKFPVRTLKFENPNCQISKSCSSSFDHSHSKKEKNHGFLRNSARMQTSNFIPPLVKMPSYSMYFCGYCSTASTKVQKYSKCLLGGNEKSSFTEFRTILQCEKNSNFLYFKKAIDC